MAPRFHVPALLLAAALISVGCASTRDLDLGTETGYSDEGTLYDDLDTYGAWVDVAPLGWVWCPEVATAWQPYTAGYWVSSDQGWLWVSEDPWGSVPYHYGRWAFDDGYGWIWVPGDVWAPAWVAWRYGDGWVGWAPLPPEVPWSVHVGTDLSPDDLDRRIRRRYWSFTKADEFGTRRERVRVASSEKDESLLERTRNITKLAAGQRPVETGLRPDLIHELRGKQIERVRIVDAAKPGAKGVRIRDGNAEVYRPQAQVNSLVRDRVRSVPSAKESKPDVPARTRAEREPAMPAQVAPRETTEPVQVSRREDVTREDRDESVRQRAERVARQREDVARQKEEAAARQRELALREREAAAKRREVMSRERKQDTVDSEDRERGNSPKRSRGPRADS
ncbi:MAG TPA: DUF6600 domain-containing protein [Candidatus Eisenbacteria bacterium]|nr:DUF6600 domain-containing protein [Candidatus Eisenbacteria bacterium]